MTEPAPARATPAWPCARLAAHVDEWLDHALPAPDVAAIATHLAHCPPCAARVAHEQRFRDSVQRCGRAEPAPESLVARVRAALRPGAPPDRVS